MANEERTLTGAIREVIRAELRFLRHYWGAVLNVGDELDRGRVQVSVPVLGWDTPVSAPWCDSSQRYSTIVPEVGDTVEVYFLEGDPSQPVYTGQVRSLKAAVIGDYDGTPTRRIIYDDPTTGGRLEYDSVAGELLFVQDGVKVFSYVAGALTFFEGGEPLVLGTVLGTFLGSLKTWLDAHTHLGVTTGGGTSGAPPAPSPTASGLSSSEVFTR